MMKKILFLSAVVFVSMACGSSRQLVHTTPAQEQEMMVGGYTQQRPLTEADRTLFATATAKLEAPKYIPESVATQIVAGCNYRFICKIVTSSHEPRTTAAEIVIFQPLPGRGDPKVSSIHLITKIDRMKPLQ
ncbi:MAG: hypothetical protein RR279_06165 [Alistipes sp.]